ncbi:putative aromatic acid transporter [Sphingobium sp. SYK-6]|uniref:MFS transporter n=1 Tax=Sphingobium sp. (strain NBRC 103272 / SYK-6) TaxID=627192 RepID=UPI0002277450|nr:MFS transporter [Sphingobium sp. SYK-6]BAK66567.1 putative aromatic acid transporter [Sphingobium sp. SYK-6]
MVDGYGVVAVAFIGKAIERVWHLDPAMLGLVFAAGPAGMMIGSLVISPFADRLGRRKVALASLLLVAISMFCAALAGNVWQLLAALAVTGLGIGGVLATLNTVVAEIAPPERRNMVMAIFSSGYPLGSTLAGGFAIGLMAKFGWPVVFVIGGTLATLVFFFNLFSLPEPPRGALPARGDDDTSWRPFGPKQRAATVAICLAFFLNMISFYFILLWTTRLTIAIGVPENVGATAMTIVNLASLVGPFLFGALADRFGLIRVAGLYFVGFGGAIALFAGATTDLWVIYMIAALIGLLMAGAMTSLYASTPLIFPAKVRAAGTGLAIGIGRLGATVGPMLAGLALQIGIGRPGLYLLFAIPPILVAILLMSGRIAPATTINKEI